MHYVIGKYFRDKIIHKILFITVIVETLVYFN